MRQRQISSTEEVFLESPFSPFSGDLPQAQVELIDALHKVSKMIQEEDGVAEIEDDQYENNFYDQQQYNLEPQLIGNIRGIAKELLQLGEKALFERQQKPSKQSFEQKLQIVQRLYDRDRQAKERIHQMKLIKLDEEKETVRPRSLMSQNSQRLLQHKQLRPFLERQEEKMLEKKDRLEAQRQQIEEQRRLKEKEVRNRDSIIFRCIG